MTPDRIRMGRITVFVLFTAAYFMSYFYRSANAVIAPDLSREMMLGVDHRLVSRQ